VALCLLAMLAATVMVGTNSPGYLAAAFSPVSLNMAVSSLAGIDLLVIGSITSAARCLRHSNQEQT